MMHVRSLETIFDVNHLFDAYSDMVHSKKRSRRMLLDLSGVSFISPLGAISLLLMIEKLEDQRDVIIIPPSERVTSYMERMDFLKHCSGNIHENISAQFDIKAMQKRHRYNKSESLMEITLIKKDEDVVHIDYSTRKILKSHGMGSRELNKVTLIVTELVTNILDHSQGNGYTAIQYYPHSKKVHLAICDNGIGIVNSLKPHLDVKGIKKELQNVDVIRSAFENGVTSSTEMTRGVGLYQMRSLLFSNLKSTAFYVRTHKEVYQITDKRIIVRREAKYFPGTYISLDVAF
jgi:anti-anti-sigma regulatory factor